MTMILIKSVVTAFMILLLVYITERNPRIGGIIAGLPGATAVMMFFFAKEQGIEFALSGLPYAIAGLSGSTSFAIGFYVGGHLYTSNTTVQAIIASIAGLGAFLATSIYVTSIQNLTFVKSLLIFVISVSTMIIFFYHVPSEKKVDTKKRTLLEIIILFSFVVGFVVFITELAKVLGPEWSGVMASFPTGPAPLLVILLLSYGNEVYPTMLKSLARSITTIVIFYLLLVGLLPLIGLYAGFFASYVLCIVYLYIINKSKYNKSPN